jgi:hypothetical protein
MAPTLSRPPDRTITADSLTIGSTPAPARAAAIAGLFLGLVESGYFERKPHSDERVTVTWLTRAIAELDRLSTAHEPMEVLNRLDVLIAELPALPSAYGD